MGNQIKTVLLLTAISALFLLIGYSLGGQTGMMSALFMSVLMNVGTYWFSDKIVLAMHRAEPIGPGNPSGVYEIIQELTQRAGLPMPKVYLIPEAAPNAFATGRNPQNSAVAVTEGILRILNERELRGVLAHEIAHIGNRDILVSTIVASIASAVMYLAHMLQWMGMMGGHRNEEGRSSINPIALIATIVFAPLAATLIQMAVSRTREFMADEHGAHVSGDPEALASALQKISNPRFAMDQEQSESKEQAAFSHLYIVNHFSGRNMMSWFSTHPPVEERVRRLLAIKERI